MLVSHPFDSSFHTVLEQYCFSPSEMFVRVTIQDYLLFLVYALEYRALVMEQMSHEEEMRYIEKYPNPDDRETGYGVVLLNFCIRDLNGTKLATPVSLKA